MTWFFLICGILFLICLLIELYHEKKLFYVIVSLITAIICIWISGNAFVKLSNSFFVIKSINQNEKGYIIKCEDIKIYQKECKYKVGDTLWIKK